MQSLVNPRGQANGGLSDKSIISSQFILVIICNGSSSVKMGSPFLFRQSDVAVVVAFADALLLVLLAHGEVPQLA